jgi:hypothetical protein
VTSQIARLAVGYAPCFWGSAPTSIVQPLDRIRQPLGFDVLGGVVMMDVATGVDNDPRPIGIRDKPIVMAAC